MNEVTNRIIAAVRTQSEMEAALKSDVEVIFDLCANIVSVRENTEQVHNAGKKLFIHIDLAEGIGKDKYGILFLRDIGIDGIISTRANLIKLAKEEGLFAVQRFFAVDSHSIETTLEGLKSSKADMIEIMPGIMPKVINKFKRKTDKPVIAGGLIENNEEISEILNSGAFAVSTGKKELWN